MMEVSCLSHGCRKHWSQVRRALQTKNTDIELLRERESFEGKKVWKRKCIVSDKELYLREDWCMMQDGGNQVNQTFKITHRIRQQIHFQAFFWIRIWLCESEAEMCTHFLSFFSRLLIKSLASSEISSNASSSKSHVAEVTLDSVSLSLSPMKGDKPLTLNTTRKK